MTEKWKGVRPIRYREEIFDVLSMLVERKSCTIDDLRLLLAESREKKEKRRLIGIQIRHTIETDIRKKEKFLTKTEQFIRVLKNLSLIEKQANIITPTKDADKIINLLKRDKLKTESLFLELLFSSTFSSYLLFIEKLIKTPVIIPKEYSIRNKEQTIFLHSRGFYLDSWSFFVIRDLFYDFGLLNFFSDDNSQKIFAVCTFNSNQIKYEQKIKTPKGILYNRPSMSLTNFVEKLVKSYLVLTNNRWGSLVNTTELRERFSEMFSISENQFNDYIPKTFSKKISSIMVIPNVGAVHPSDKKSNLIKILNLPRNKAGIPFTLIRIKKEE
jgi:hypothetical protein